MSLPGDFDGLETLIHLRKEAGFTELAIAILTGDRSPRKMSMALELGASDFVIKPTSLKRFRENVHRSLQDFLGEDMHSFYKGESVRPINIVPAEPIP